MGTLAAKTVDWTKVPDEELVTNIDDMDLAEEAEKCWKEEEERHQKEAEAEQKEEAKKAKQATAAEARKQQWVDSEAQASRSQMNIVSHLEKIVGTSQSNGQKMQCHYMLMEGLVGQQQMLLSRLVEIVSATGSGGMREVVEGTEELKELQEMQGEGLGGQEETEGVPGGAPEDEPEDAPGNEPENGAGVEDGTGEEAQKKDKGKGKEKAT
ncbi:hypothetical protein ID866_11991 [Astraeus odoratus]|nr:hypothetical protein ID866_11991 [Astraeus odoratus]